MVEQKIYKEMPATTLNYTTLTPYICKESLNIPIGHPCLNKKTIDILEKNKIKVLGKDYTKNKYPISGPENIPFDGSLEARTVLDYLSNLSEISEYSLLQNKKINKLLGTQTIEKELKRFKPPGERYTAEGTIVHKEGFEILLDWADVFKTFYPFEPLEFTIKNIKKVITEEYINKSTKKRKRVFGCLMNIMTEQIQTDQGLQEMGCHAIVVLIDLRENKSEWTIDFYDSAGAPPDYDIAVLLEQILNFLESLNKSSYVETVKIVTANARLIHQNTDAECAMHGLIFIRRRLEGIPALYFGTLEKVTDDFAINFRKFIYSN